MGAMYLIKKRFIYPVDNDYGDIIDFDYDSESVGVVYSLEQAVAACQRLNDAFDITTDEHCGWIYDDEYEHLFDLMEEEEFHDPYYFEKIEVLKEAM